jgi:outer membrane protein OmpA-like peptidoglycan-associated protein
MRNMFKVTLGIITGALLICPSVSRAEEHSLTLKLDTGVAVSHISPQSDRFHPGVAIQATPMLGVTPWFNVGPTLSLTALPSKTGLDVGTSFGVGVAGLVQRPHNESNTGNGWSAVSPWLSGEVELIHTDPLNRAQLSIAAGAAVPTSSTRNLWVGPFARYQDVVESLNDRPRFDTTDAHVFIFGVSLEFGGGVHEKKDTPAVQLKAVVTDVSDRDHDGTPDTTDRCPDVPGPKENQGCPWPTVEEIAAHPVEINQVVYFAFDSNVINSTENPQLVEVVKTLLANVNYTATVEGYASSEGQPDHNQALSQRRADAVVSYLVNAGVTRERLTAVGYGTTNPVADNATEAGRVLNRRVEFVVKLIVNGDSK